MCHAVVYNTSYCRRYSRFYFLKKCLRAVSLRKKCRKPFHLPVRARAQRPHTSHYTYDICTASMQRPMRSNGAQTVAVERSRRAHNAHIALLPLL